MVDNLLEQYTKAQQSRQVYFKRRKIVIAAVSSFIILTATFFGLYGYTDKILGPDVSLDSVSAAGEWAMFHHSPSHAGSINPGSSPPQGTIKSVFATGGAIYSSPAVADGIVYFGSRDNKLYALDTASGTKLWEFETGSWVDSSPVVANGTVYFGSNDSRLYALDARTGEERWCFKTDYAIRSAPAVADGIVVLGSTDFYIYGLDASNGTELWRFETGNNVTSSPVIVNGIVYIGSMDGSLYALNADSGRLRLRYEAYSPLAVSPAAGNGIVYFGSHGGFVYAIDAMARNWPFENNLIPYWRTLFIYGVLPQPPLPSGLLWSLNLRETISSSPTLSGDNLYISAGHELFAIDIQQQETRWSFETGDIILSSPAVVNKTVYVGSTDGHLYALEATTGNKLWDIPCGGWISSSPAVANGEIFLGSHDGNLYIIE